MIGWGFSTLSQGLPYGKRFACPTFFHDVSRAEGHPNRQGKPLQPVPGGRA